MNPLAFQKFGRKALGMGATALALLSVAACGSSSTSSSTASTPGGSTTPSCSVTAADLSLGAGGTATAPQVNITGSKTLSIDGSTALAPLFQDAAKSFQNVNGVQVTINPNGSGTGLKDVEAGAVQIGMSDVFAIEKATSPTGFSDLVDHQVAVVAFTLVVSPDLQGKITNLTTQQIKDIYDGTDTNWQQVGGPNEPINVVVRTKTSGTRATFKRYVLGDPNTTNDEPPGSQEADKTGELVSKVSSTNGAIGYTATSFVLNQDQASKIVPICIDGYGATAANINSGNYKFWSYEHAYTKGTPATNSAADAFLKFVLSNDFQSQDLPKLGFLTTNQLTDAAKATHPTPTYGN